jgi:hypothetical protein
VGSAASGGGCTPSASAVVPPLAWNGAVRVCGLSAPAGGSCDAGGICAPRTGLPFASDTYCVARAGAQTCPADYPSARTFYESASDTRACTACTCGAETGAACDVAVVSTFGDSLCHSGANNQSSSDGCVRKNASKTATAAPVALTSGGACEAQGGTSTGGVTPTTPTTICCTM